jgi:hypothetical protein
MKKLVLLVRSYFANIRLDDAFKAPIISLRGKNGKSFRGKLVGAKW